MWHLVWNRVFECPPSHSAAATGVFANSRQDAGSRSGFAVGSSSHLHQTSQHNPVNAASKWPKFFALSQDKFGEENI